MSSSGRTDPEVQATRPRHPPRTPVSELADALGLTLLTTPGEPATEVSGISLSGQRILPGDLYAALPGSRVHGVEYAGQAVAAGAVALLTDPAGADRVSRSVGPLAGVPVLVADDPRRLLGRLAARVYDDPATRMRMIGVTGTQGKTTTTRLLSGALELAGESAGVIGTVGTRIAGQDVKTSLTTPEAPDLHGLFATMAEEGVGTCVMEVSSHSLVMGRVDGIVFDVAVFLNLGRDHLDFHKDLEDYYQAKASLFTPERARLGLVCLDDAHGRRLAGEAAAGIPVRTFAVGEEHAAADWRATDLRLGPAGSDFTLVGPDVEAEVHVPLPGDFNVANALAALAAAGEAGLDVAALATAMGKGGGVPGRLERIDEGQPFTVVVDYAHKPDAVEAALRTLRPLTEGRLIVVLGAGGDRDQGKRPVMGEIAARLADVLLVTDDNPRSEEPAAIRAAILAGTTAGAAEVSEMGDRGEAIAAAIGRAEPGDIVLIAGKGHESGQEIAGTVHPFDDREVARRALLGLRPQ